MSDLVEHGSVFASVLAPITSKREIDRSISWTESQL
jgi:hypothetical protein